MAAAVAATTGGNEQQSFDDKVKEVIKAEVFMLSGCCDNQTSADVADTASFKLPDDVGVAGSGGACTNALLALVGTSDGDFADNYCDVMKHANTYLKEHGYTQKPCLSTSRRQGMDQLFSVLGENTGGKKHALHIGINYIGHSCGVLSGCVNDALAWNHYLNKLGFENGNIKILVDEDPKDEHFAEDLAGRDTPTRDNITEYLKWLVAQTGPGDVAVLTYSGHGVQVPDECGDEEDGKDECLAPMDYQSAGFITDDELLNTLVVPLPSGARLVCIMDCCHSGTILDLPFTFLGDENGMQCLEADPKHAMLPNEGFAGKLKKFAKKIPGFEHLSKLGLF
eukprot:TRINITY_DN17934_c0_g1_i1.p1 TRINITY_DN17934_c0_g1~~TRINITY_DN17934_c0_g1_i1.p1  ORF type:complete len:381 (+),score=185.72 TRINITY_DN17934_c0_g1_i1:130-1143(+)